MMRFYTCMGAILICIFGQVTFAHAGLLDNIKAAAQKLENQANNSNSSAPADENHPLNIQYKGSCEGHRSATCMDYGEGMDQCMAPIRGYRMKVLGDRIEQKLKTDTNLTDSQRKNLQEDLNAAREASKNGSDEPTIAGNKKSQRYLSDISDEDQIWVNAEFGRFRNTIYNKCVGADHMQTGHRTEMITDMGMSGDEAVAQYRKEHPARHRQTNTCGQQIGALRYQIMANMMEKKMGTLHLSDKERADWQADIAAVKDAASSGGTTMPKVNDPANPYRPLTRLSSPEDMMAFNNEFTSQSQMLMEKCRNSR